MIEFGFVFIGGLVIAVFGYAFSRLIIKNGEETHEEDGEEDGEPEEGKACETTYTKGGATWLIFLCCI
jgi:hypothetical protein